ncbi:MAG: RNA helicase, partial [Symploca sp. SIO2G7]|nr:RNA helicase [Symploca sp. SIO2G7]
NGIVRGTSGADPLVSQFTPTYGMVLNLLQTHSITEAKDLVERSFAQYRATLYLKPLQQEITELTTELAKIDIQLAPMNVADFNSYEKLTERLREERRLLKTLQKQAEEEQLRSISQALLASEAGTILYLKGKQVKVSSPIPAVLVTKEKGQGQSPYLVCLSAANRWYVVTTADVVGLSGVVQTKSFDIGTLQPPESLNLKRGEVKRGTSETEALSALVPSNPEIAVAPEVIAQARVVEAVKTQLDEHPLRQWGNPTKLLKRHSRRLALQAKINQLQAKFREKQAHHWQEFLNLMEILRIFHCLDEVKPTPQGQATAAIRGENELWLGLVLMSGKLDELAPQHLGAAMSALVTETLRSGSFTNYSPTVAVTEMLDSLKPMRRTLFKLQHKYRVALPVWLEYELIGLVEEWALGVEWSDLCDNTNLDEGNIVRILRRTVDILSQIPHVPGVSESLRRNAIRAIQLLDRFPVNEAIN